MKGFSTSLVIRKIKTKQRKLPKKNLRTPGLKDKGFLLKMLINAWHMKEKKKQPYKLRSWDETDDTLKWDNLEKRLLKKI